MAAMQDDMEKMRREKDAEIDAIMLEYESKLQNTVEEVKNACNKEKEVSTCHVSFAYVVITGGRV